jgi:FMN reductase
MTIAFISASPSVASRSGALLSHAGTRLRAYGLQTQTLNLRELPPAALLNADRQEPSIAEALETLAGASLVVLATPIYKAAYSGLLKVFLDLLPQDGLRGKWVWALGTSGSPAHLLALDFALAPVLASLGARQHIDPVYANDADFHDLQPSEALQRRLASSASLALQALLPQSPAFATAARC